MKLFGLPSSKLTQSRSSRSDSLRRLTRKASHPLLAVLFFHSVLIRIDQHVVEAIAVHEDLLLLDPLRLTKLWLVVVGLGRFLLNNVMCGGGAEAALAWQGRGDVPEIGRGGDLLVIALEGALRRDHQMMRERLGLNGRMLLQMRGRGQRRHGLVVRVSVARVVVHMLDLLRQWHPRRGADQVRIHHLGVVLGPSKHRNA